MACTKLGSKAGTFKREGQAWYCTNGLPSDITVNVDDMSFHLHKFPLLSKSGLLEKLIEEKSIENTNCTIDLHGMPGGAKAFELVTKFCYGIKFELTASNVVQLRCASEYLKMTEEISESNLIFQTEHFLNHTILRSWKDSIKALQTCDGELLPHAENLHIVKKCIDSLATKACTDPNLFGWPMADQWGFQSPGGSVLWNGISTGAKPINYSSDWWYDDVSSLSFPLYKRLVKVMDGRGIADEVISGSVEHYAKKYLPSLNQRQSSASTASVSTHTEEEEKDVLEEICNLLPNKKGMVTTKFLFRLIKTGMILKASESCLSNLEKKAGMQLDDATLEDLLMPTFSNSMETLYNIDCVERILDNFLAMDQVESCENSTYLVEEEHAVINSSLYPLTNVAKLIDDYLAEVASDVNLKLPKFQAVASAVPEYARPLDDGLYRAIDIYLKAHPWLQENEREEACRIMDCQKLSMEACTHAAQNERLPLRIVVKVLHFEQLQLRSYLAGFFPDNSRPLTSGSLAVPPDMEGGGAGLDWTTGSVRENEVLKVGMDSMRLRVSELEEEFSTMRKEVEKLGKDKSGSCSGWSLRFRFSKKNQMCDSDREDDDDGEKLLKLVEKNNNLYTHER